MLMFDVGGEQGTHHKFLQSAESAVSVFLETEVLY